MTSLDCCCCSLLSDRACSSSAVREGRGTAMALQRRRLAAAKCLKGDGKV